MNQFIKKNTKSSRLPKKDLHKNSKPGKGEEMD